MKKYYLLLLISFIFTTNQAQTITFDDAVFKAKLLESDATNFIARDLNGDYFAIDINNNNEIEVAEATQVTYLEVNDALISSLNGVDNFTNLVSLQCQNNQINVLNVSSLLLLTYLDCSNNQLNFLNVNGLTELSYLNCSFNSLTNLNASGINNLTTLDCSYNNLVTINLSNLISLETLNCSNNQIGTTDFTDLISLKNLDCSSNSFINLNADTMVSLQQLNCNFNSINTLTITNLNSLTSVECTNNLLANLNIVNLPVLTTLNCNNNQLPLINISAIPNLKNLSCSNNLINSLNLNGFSLLENVSCQNNQIVDITGTGLSNLITLNCDFNQLTTLELDAFINLKYLYCNNNQLTTLTFLPTNLLQVVSCNNNAIAIINTSSLSNLQSFYASNNQLTTLDLNNAFNLQSLFCSNNLLTELFIKNGTSESNLQFTGNSNLNYICADELDLEYIQTEIDTNGYNCTVNTYCSFVPGGMNYTVQGSTIFDVNSNGCDASDNLVSNLQFSVSNGSTTEINFANSTGNYSKLVNSGSYTMTPILENPSYFTISPTDFSFEFPFNASPLNQNFCVLPNGTHTDLEIVLFPLISLTTSGNTSYKINYKNKGTVSQSGTVSLNFDDGNLNVLSSNPAATSQTTNNLSWNFSNLAPFETRSISIIMNTENVSVGQLLAFTSTITSSNTDEHPTDNTCNLNQTVVATSLPNDKKCVEGNTISESQVGEYVHYCIRFKNTGSSVAQNVVVKDVIDGVMFDVASLIPLDGSHSFTTKILNTSRVEFVFENINLSNGSNNEGFVLFKIKTLPTLTNGSTFSNTATIYFDYNDDFTTNSESTIVQSLNANQVQFSNDFRVVPNPASEIISVENRDNSVVQSLEIYNSIGQLVQVITHPKNNLINVSALQSGIYILQIGTEKGKSSIRFSKK